MCHPMWILLWERYHNGFNGIEIALLIINCIRRGLEIICTCRAIFYAACKWAITNNFIANILNADEHYSIQFSKYK